MAIENANPPSKAGGVLAVLGMLLALIGVAMMASIALTVPGVVVLIAGLMLAATTFAGAKVAARAPKA